MRVECVLSALAGAPQFAGLLLRWHGGCIGECLEWAATAMYVSVVVCACGKEKDSGRNLENAT